MKKKTFLFLLVGIAALVIIFDLFFSRWLIAKVSTIPLLNRWKLISPQGAIVINTREEVRYSDSGDVLAAVNLTKAKLGAVVIKSGSGQISYGGGAVNLTSDGLFLTVKSVVGSNRLENVFVKTDDGSLIAVTGMADDPATSLVILKTGGSNIAAAAFGDSKNLAPGQRVMFLANSFLDSSPFFENNFVSAGQLNNYSDVKNSDSPSRSFQLQNQDQLINGTAVVNLDGQVVGLWDTGSVISSDVIKDTLADYFSDPTWPRPQFGFKYKDISTAEKSLLGETFGARVVQITAAPALKAGLEVGDGIVSVDGNNLTKNTSLEELLQKYRPGDTATFAVLRDKQTINLQLKVGALK